MWSLILNSASHPSGGRSCRISRRLSELSICGRDGRRGAPGGRRGCPVPERRPAAKRFSLLCAELWNPARDRGISVFSRRGRLARAGCSGTVSCGAGAIWAGRSDSGGCRTVLAGLAGRGTGVRGADHRLPLCAGGCDHRT